MKAILHQRNKYTVSDSIDSLNQYHKIYFENVLEKSKKFIFLLSVYTIHCEDILLPSHRNALMVNFYSVYLKQLHYLIRLNYGHS